MCEPRSINRSGPTSPTRRAVLRRYRPWCCPSFATSRAGPFWHGARHVPTVCQITNASLNVSSATLASEAPGADTRTGISQSRAELGNLARRTNGRYAPACSHTTAASPRAFIATCGAAAGSCLPRAVRGQAPSRHTNTAGATCPHVATVVRGPQVPEGVDPVAETMALLVRLSCSHTATILPVGAEPSWTLLTDSPGEDRPCATPQLAADASPNADWIAEGRDSPRGLGYSPDCSQTATARPSASIATCGLLRRWLPCASVIEGRHPPPDGRHAPSIA